MLALAGCAVGPDYVRPALPQPAHYLEPGNAAEPAQDAGQSDELPAEWWGLYRSPALDALVHQSFANNPGLAAAQAALRAAIETRRAQQGVALPQVDVGYSATRQKIAGTLASPAASGSLVYTLHTAQLDLSYTPDLFGANRRAVESLQAQADVQRFELEATSLSLATNLVVAAVDEAALREQRTAAARLVEIQREWLARGRRLLALGQIGAIDVAGLEAALAAAESALPPLDRQVAQQRDLVKALLGELPEHAGPAPIELSDLRLPETLPSTLPSTLVDHRPDVLAAEQQLRQASAAIGIARADRLPAVTLGVNAWGSAALTLSRLFSSGTGFWTLSAGASQSVFDGGSAAHREQAAREAYAAALAQYRAALINAYQNVADALQGLAADGQALRIARQAQAAAEHSLAIVRRQLELGDASVLAVLAAEQNALQARIATAQAEGNRLADAAGLIQALGGGWWNRPAAAARVSSAAASAAKAIGAPVTPPSDRTS